MNLITLFRAPACPCAILICTLALQAAEPGASRTVTVAECLRRAAEQSPELKSGSYRTEAAARRAKLAARPINPRLETEVENVAGSGEVRGVDAAESTVALSQEIELGAKRRHRTEVAEAETAVIRAEQDVRLRTALYETRRAALVVQSAQEKARLAEEALALIRETESVAEAREKAGKATVLETERARAETAKAEIELETRKAEQRDAVRDLALSWGETEPTFDAVSDALDTGDAARPPLDALLLKAASNPDLQAAEAQVRTYEARIGAERAARVPNLEVSAGVRRFEDGDDIGFVAGASIELPFYTRNSDGVKAAEADAEAARLETVAARLRSEGHIRRLYARLNTLAAKTARLKDTVSPAAERTLSLVRAAHRLGKAGYLDVLEARRTLVEARLQLIETVTEYQGARLELGRLSNTLSEIL
jgi:cobalt-zinc-cadmium efflux system outer membrane protein